MQANASDGRRSQHIRSWFGYLPSSHGALEDMANKPRTSCTVDRFTWCGTCKSVWRWNLQKVCTVQGIILLATPKSRRFKHSNGGNAKSNLCSRLGQCQQSSALVVSIRLFLVMAMAGALNQSHLTNCVRSQSFLTRHDAVKTPTIGWKEHSQDPPNLFDRKSLRVSCKCSMISPWTNPFGPRILEVSSTQLMMHSIYIYIYMYGSRSKGPCKGFYCEGLQGPGVRPRESSFWVRERDVFSAKVSHKLDIMNHHKNII